MIEFGKLEYQPIKFDSEDRHQLMMAAIEKYAKPVSQGNLTPVEIVKSTRNTKLLLVILPQWAHSFPPYNLARLGSTAQAAGYQTTIWDLNVKARRQYTQGLWPSLDYDPWHPARDWHWQAPQYFNDLHAEMLPLMEDYLRRIAEMQPDLIGFTLYYSNLAPSHWMIQQIKARWPRIKIVVGGSATHGQFLIPEPEWDFVINGEGEHQLLKLLDGIERGEEFVAPMIMRQAENERIDLDQLPVPDYSFFDFADYSIPNGVCSELSRGCTAKCTFCEETHFYRYRQRRASSILNELSYLYNTYNVNCVYFIDSLVNGNLNELRAFCKGIIASGMKLHWTGYARCDGRMDLEFYQDLADSGCVALNYGCESGSQPVLDDIDKRVSVTEMEENFRSSKITGVQAYTNWIVAFPTETRSDYANTMTMIWRNRNNNITAISPGQGFSASMDSIVGQNRDRFGLMQAFYLDQWMRADLTMGKLHRLIRAKTFNIFLDHLMSEKYIHTSTRPKLKELYEITFFDPNMQLEIEYETFDYDIIKPDLGPFADNAFNEIWPLLRTLWRTRGGFYGEIRFDTELDLAEWGRHNAVPFDAVFKFTIDWEGHWLVDFDLKFTQPNDAWIMSANNRDEITNATRRARALSRVESTAPLPLHPMFEHGPPDLSFSHAWQGQGHWVR
jgi:B12 binding domain/Radical SAM superfamily